MPQGSILKKGSWISSHNIIRDLICLTYCHCVNGVEEGGIGLGSWCGFEGGEETLLVEEGGAGVDAVKVDVQSELAFLLQRMVRECWGKGNWGLGNLREMDDLRNRDGVQYSLSLY